VIGWIILAVYLVGGFLAFRWAARDMGQYVGLDFDALILSGLIALLWPLMWPGLYLTEYGDKHDWGRKIIRFFEKITGVKHD
jgi:hypothetical protein